MTNATQVWLVTGAGRGLGVDIVKAALNAGHAVVATGRDPAKVGAALGEHPNLLIAKLDVTEPADARDAVARAVEHFGSLDVVVNNAGNFYGGFFEDLAPEQVRQQFETLLFGPMNVVRACLPTLRKQRSGLLLTISSTAGIAGFEFCTAYASAKFAVEGWMEALTPEVARFGIKTMTVEPGFFRTDLLTPESTTFADSTVADYAEAREEIISEWSRMNGRQSGDPAKLASTLVTLVASGEPPLRFPAGEDALETFVGKADRLMSEAEAHSELSSSLAH